MAVPGVGECGDVNVEYSGDFAFGRLRDSWGNVMTRMEPVC